MAVALDALSTRTKLNLGEARSKHVCFRSISGNARTRPAASGTNNIYMPDNPFGLPSGKKLAVDKAKASGAQESGRSQRTPRGGKVSSRSKRNSKARDFSDVNSASSASLQLVELNERLQEEVARLKDELAAATERAERAEARLEVRPDKRYDLCHAPNPHGMSPCTELPILFFFAS